MKDLIKWQIISFISRGVAMALGIIQSIVIVRILTVGEYGLVNIAVSVGSAFGIYQHLGLASGSTREISSADSKEEIFKIFVTSVVIRYFVTIPLAIFLFITSKYVAVAQYGNEAMITPLRLFALVLVVQGVQSMFNSIVSGMQRFKQLFVYQMAIAAVSLFVYIPLIYFYRVNGYFYALVLFNLIGSLSLGIMALWPIRGHLQMPTRADFKRLLKEILSISLGIYAVKIIYTYWQKSGPLLLGLSLTPEEVGIFSFALLYGAKLMTVSDSITDVNLPVLSKKFVENMEEFKEMFAKNFDKIFAFIVFAAASAVFWTKEVFHIFVGSDKYDAAFPLVLPIIFAFIFYSIVNIVKSSIIIPAKLVKEMIFAYVLMLLITVGTYFGLTPMIGSLSAMAYGMAFGSLSGILSMLVTSKISLDFSFIGFRHLFVFVIGLVLALISFDTFSLMKFGTYTLVSFVYLWVLFKLQMVTKEQLSYLFGAVKGRIRKNV